MIDRRDCDALDTDNIGPHYKERDPDDEPENPRNEFDTFSWEDE